MKRFVFGLAMIASLAIGTLGMTSTALGQPSDLDEWGILIYLHETENPVQVTDLSRNSIGTGFHLGQLLCNRTCTQKTQLYLNGIEYQYRFETYQAVDPDAGRVVAAGRGTLSTNGQKERFAFTATFTNNGDGTVGVRYEASRPDASFIVPQTLGTFIIFARP